MQTTRRTFLGAVGATAALGVAGRGHTYQVKAGDWLLIPPDTPHQPKPDPGGFSYFIMKINVGVYPWSLIR
jgi:hypothetical protein